MAMSCQEKNLMPTGAIVLQPDAPDRWERALCAFLAEKERRSGSIRTVQSYSRMLRYFFGKLAKSPDAILPADVLAYAHGVGLSGKEPSAITIGARIACVSSFFKFLIRVEILDRNPCDALEHPKTPQSTPRGLSAEEVRQLLTMIPEDARREARSGDHSDVAVDGAAPCGSPEPHSGQHRTRRPGLLHLPRQGRHKGAAWAATSGLRGPRGGAIGLQTAIWQRWTRPRRSGPRRRTWAACRAARSDPLRRVGVETRPLAAIVSGLPGGACAAPRPPGPYPHTAHRPTT